jgi:hypothetical protein
VRSSSGETLETRLDLRPERLLLPPEYGSSDPSFCSQHPPSSVASLLVAIAAAAAAPSAGSERIVKTLPETRKLT